MRIVTYNLEKDENDMPMKNLCFEIRIGINTAVIS